LERPRDDGSDDRSSNAAWPRQENRPLDNCCELLVLAAPGFSAFALVSMLEILRGANRMVGRRVVRWSFVDDTIDGTVPLLTGLLADGRAISGNEARRGRHAMTLVFADRPIDRPSSSPLISTIRASHRAGSRIVEIGSGAFLLPMLGLLDHDRYSVHPGDRAVLMEKFPLVRVADTMFSAGQRTISCCGQAGAIELAFFLVEQMCGPSISDAVRRAMLFDKRPGQGSACLIPSARGGDLTNRHLQRAFEIMQTHLEDPLSQTQVARHCRLSARQLQRLFSSLIGETFHQAYMQLRLDRAYQLLKQTDMPIVEVAVACGFTNGSYFAQAARRRWNMTPSHVRSRPEAAFA